MSDTNINTQMSTLTLTPDINIELLNANLSENLTIQPKSKPNQSNHHYVTIGKYTLGDYH